MDSAFFDAESKMGGGFMESVDNFWREEDVVGGFRGLYTLENPVGIWIQKCLHSASPP